MFFLKKKRLYRNGDLRVVKRFAWYPRICREHWDNRVDSTVRWLQTVYIRQEYIVVWEGSWKNIEFVTEAEYLEHNEETRAILSGPHPTWPRNR